MKKLHGGGEISPKRIIQSNNTNSSSSSSDPPELEKTPPEEDNDFICDLKEKLKKLNPSFVFDKLFYQRAFDFMALYGLDSGFISWMYEFCVKQMPKKIDGYFYKVFFDPRLVEQYKNYLRPPPIETLRCPVCGFEHDAADLLCPQCHLLKACIHDSKAIERQKFLFAMPADIRESYEQEYDKIMEETPLSEMKASKHKLDTLEQKYKFR